MAPNKYRDLIQAIFLYVKSVKLFLTTFFFLGVSSVRSDILSRFFQFVQGLRVSPSRKVTVMCGVAAGDVSTTTGQNLHMIRLETGLDPLASQPAMVKAAILSRVQEVPELDTWGVEYLGKQLEPRCFTMHAKVFIIYISTFKFQLKRLKYFEFPLKSTMKH